MKTGFIPIKADPQNRRTWYMCINCGYTLPASSEPRTCPICHNAQQPPETALKLIDAQKAPF